MPVTLKDVENIAMLAKLRFTQEEKERLISQLSRILSYFEKLNELDTTDVEPTSHVLPIKNVFRDDVVTGSLPRDQILANAPDQWMGYFKVPKVIE
ncbi:MAG TPA: Asp-tRNA(Asn)/Glu-tRNA(Gln) amidotransferase subunit GatC [Candidatus Latescibacteria bacterium]|nr:Asp-tRNA(Asn)/Glu-tRNA(Gln) amidotransferase subunit GatC [Candidatus Latescibacterota bacterium]